MVRKWWLSCLLTVGAAGVWSMLAPARVLADPPGRVARLNYLMGAVSLRPAGSDAWAAAVPNRPLTTGDAIWADSNSRAELHAGSTSIRVDGQTELDLTLLDDNTMQLRLAQGSVTIRVRHLDDGQVYEIDTPNGAITLGRAGEYRVDVGPDGTTSVVDVWSGNAEVTAAGSSFAVNARQQARINGTDSPTYDLVDAPAYDEWDQWCADRDRREDTSESARYVSTEMTGYEDLDAYGHWEVMPEYGNVWVPSGMGPGWAPYHTGHWVWVDPWGWTWVDEAPWGYAPYHYGRWVYAGGGWAWVPGQMVARPVYSPALVAFVGAPAPRPGVAVGVAVGVGAVAWFALGPQEVYHPAYAVSPAYVRQVNVTNVTNVTNITNVTNVTNVNNVTYVNRNAPGAMMATSTTTFTSARPVQAAPLQVTDEMRQAPVMGSAPHVMPTEASLGRVQTQSGAAVRMPPANVVNRPVMAKLAPPPAPVSFASQRSALEANQGRPLAPAQVSQIRASSPRLASNAALVRPATVAPAGGGLRPMRSGITPATSVAKGPSGFVARPNATGPTGVRVAQPSRVGSEGSNLGNGSEVGRSSTVPQPPARSTTVAVPHRVTTGSSTQGSGSGGSNPPHASGGSNGTSGGGHGPPVRARKVGKSGNQGAGKGEGEGGKDEKHPSSGL